MKYIVTISTDVIVEAEDIYQAEGIAFDKFCETFDEDLILNAGYDWVIKGN